MKIFGQLIRTVVNTAVLPVKIVQDTVTAIPDVGMEGKAFMRTAEQLRRLKDEAGE